MPILLPELQIEDCCQSNVLKAAARPMQGASRQPRSIAIGLSEFASLSGRTSRRQDCLSRPHGGCVGSSMPRLEYEYVGGYVVLQLVGFVVRRLGSVSIGMTGADLTARWSLTEHGSRTRPC